MVSLGILWHLDSCPLPVNQSVERVVKQMRVFVGQRHPNNVYVKHFFCVCDSRQLSDTMSDELNSCGVNVIHVNHKRVNGVTDQLQQLIDLFVDTNYGHEFKVLVLISGDIDLSQCVRNARRMDTRVMLIHGLNASQQLIGSANESYLFEDILKSVEIKSKNSLNESKPKVCDENQSKPVTKDLETRREDQMTKWVHRSEEVFKDETIVNSFIANVEKDIKQRQMNGKTPLFVRPTSDQIQSSVNLQNDIPVFETQYHSKQFTRKRRPTGRQPNDSDNCDINLSINTTTTKPQVMTCVANKASNNLPKEDTPLVVTTETKNRLNDMHLDIGVNSEYLKGMEEMNKMRIKIQKIKEQRRLEMCDQRLESAQLIQQQMNEKINRKTLYLL